MGKNQCLTHWSHSFKPAHDKTNIMTCSPSEDSDQPHCIHPVWSVFAVCMKEPWILSYPLSTDLSSLSVQVILLVLSHCGSFVILWVVSLVSIILISVISMCFISWNSPRKKWHLCIHARVCLSPLIMSYCRRVVVLTFIFHVGRCMMNGHHSIHIVF